MQTEQKAGMVIVDHGSRFAAANDMLEDVARMFKRVSGYAIVEPAHMELAEPTIPQAIAACVRQGATQVIVHPYFLSPGRHSTTDIPRITAEAAAEHPGVTCHVTAPLGVDEGIAKVMMERIEHCIASQFECEYCHARGCSMAGKPAATKAYS